MDTQPAQALSSLLAHVDRHLAEPASRPLERLLSRTGASDSLIVALVGPTGVGKSTLVNLLAGERIVVVGPLRPTTTNVSVWGDVSDVYLPGTRLTAAGLPDRVALVDTPAAEHYPDRVADVLDRVDAALLVVSPDRYADAVTAAAMEALTERAIPVRLVVVAEVVEGRDIEAIASDTTRKLGLRVDAIVVEDARPALALLEAMADDRQNILQARDRGAAAFTAARARDVADRFAGKAAEAEAVSTRAAHALEGATVERSLLAGVADEEWSAAVGEIAALRRSATDDAISGLDAEFAADASGASLLTPAAVSLPGVDQRPIEDWHRAASEEAVRSMRHPRLHPRRRRAVRDDMWRLAVDFDRTPSKRVRKALGARIPDMRIDLAADLKTALARSTEVRIGAFLNALDPYADVTPDEIRTAASALAAESEPQEGGGTDE